MPLLPLLENEYEATRRLVADGVDNAGLPSEALDAFPFAALVGYALEWETDSWPSDAIRWLERGFPINQDIANALGRLKDDARRSQSVRHKAAALAKKWAKRDV
jgi:hypothetical protein